MLTVATVSIISMHNKSTYINHLTIVIKHEAKRGDEAITWITLSTSLKSQAVNSSKISK